MYKLYQAIIRYCIVIMGFSPKVIMNQASDTAFLTQQKALYHHMRFVSPHVSQTETLLNPSTYFTLLSIKK